MDAATYYQQVAAPLDSAPRACLGRCWAGRLAWPSFSCFPPLPSPSRLAGPRQGERRAFRSSQRVDEMAGLQGLWQQTCVGRHVWRGRRPPK